MSEIWRGRKPRAHGYPVDALLAGAGVGVAGTADVALVGPGELGSATVNLTFARCWAER